MALVMQGVMQVTIPLVDETGSHGQFVMNFQFNDPGDIASVLAAIVAGVPAIQALSGASATGLTVSIPYREDNVTAPDPGSRIERRGRWDLINTEGRRFSITIPAISPSLVDGLGYINRLDPRVIAFEAFLQGSSASDSRGVEIGGILDAREVFRASTRTSRPKIRG